MNTQPETQHTPTPWQTAEGSYGHYVAIIDANGKTVARVPWGKGDGQNAAFIVRAVNTHAQLVAALEIIAGMKSGPCPIMHTLENAQDFARAALSAAKEGQQ